MFIIPSSKNQENSLNSRTLSKLPETGVKSKGKPVVQQINLKNSIKKFCPDY